MCGIWGFFKRQGRGTNNSDITLLRSMMITTALRGDHSSGVCVTAADFKKKPPLIKKQIGSPFNILHRAQDWDAITKFADNDAKYIFGHGRHATRGDITVANAHPFVEGRYVLVHNGTIWNQPEAKDREDVTVDSHHLCVRMSQVGIEAALKEISGAYAIIVYDKEDGAIYAARNDDRPLHYFDDPVNTYIMSEREALQMVLTRHNRYIYPQGFPKTIMEFEPNQLYIHDGKKGFTKFANVEKTYPKYEPLVVAAGPVTAGTNYASWPYNAGQNGSSSGRRTGDLVDFSVERIVKKGSSNFCYQGKTIDESKMLIEFQMAIENLELIGAVGRAPLRSRVYPGGGAQYWQIRTADIVWDIPEDNENPLPTTSAGGTGKATDLIGVCDQCDVEIRNPRLRLANGKPICPRCATEWEFANKVSFSGVLQ